MLASQLYTSVSVSYFLTYQRHLIPICFRRRRRKRNSLVKTLSLEFENPSKKTLANVLDNQRLTEDEQAMSGSVSSKAPHWLGHC